MLGAPGIVPVQTEEFQGLLAIAQAAQALVMHPQWVALDPAEADLERALAAAGWIEKRGEHALVG